VLVVVAKAAVAYGVVRLTGLSDSPLQVAVGLGQIGEFSFVLASVVLARGAIGPEIFAAIHAAVAISITGSTILVRVARRPPTPALAVADQ
jgi:K+:H+ antiporter